VSQWLRSDALSLFGTKPDLIGPTPLHIDDQGLAYCQHLLGLFPNGRPLPRVWLGDRPELSV
jgi:hypothetical protein